MLYHVPDRARAIAEIRRILQPEGRFYASTIGRDHMRKIGQLLHSIHPDVDDPHFLVQQLNTFRLENGATEIAQSFAHVETHRHERRLAVTETEPLMAYILSGRLKAVLSVEMQETLRERIEQEIMEQGAVRIDTVSGMFVASGVK
jgi:SAM-dependent methyltransferase